MSQLNILTLKGRFLCKPKYSPSKQQSDTEHVRDFRRGQVIYNPWHYLPILARKLGALRNGAPFKDWDLPPGLAAAQAKLRQHADGDRQFVKILAAVLDHGLPAVEAACAEALEAGIASGDVILAVLARQLQPPTPASMATPESLRLKVEPMADCARYDDIRKAKMLGVTERVVGTHAMAAEAA